MAVVTKYGSALNDPAVVGAQVSAVLAEARVKRINSVISITNADSIASVFYIGKVPTDAIIDPRSAYWYTALTGLTDIDVGFFKQDGTVIDADNLVDGDDVAAAGTQTLFGHGTLLPANFTKRAWELAGLANDPGGMFLIGATLKVAAGATGTITFIIDYSVK